MNHRGPAGLPVQINEGENSRHDREEAEMIVDGMKQQHGLVSGQMIDSCFAEFFHANRTIERDHATDPLIDQRIGIPRCVTWPGSAGEHARERPIDQVVDGGMLFRSR